MNEHTTILRKHFTDVLELPEQACNYLCDLFETIQSLDDWVDGDPSTPDEKSRAIWNSLAGLQLNPFVMQNPCLLWAQGLQFLKWLGADQAERTGTSLHTAFVWRAGYYDIVLLVVLLVHGSEKAMRLAHLVLSMYGESFADYEKEFGDARSSQRDHGGT